MKRVILALLTLHLKNKAFNLFIMRTFSSPVTVLEYQGSSTKPEWNNNKICTMWILFTVLLYIVILCVDFWRLVLLFCVNTLEPLNQSCMRKHTWPMKTILILIIPATMVENYTEVILLSKPKTWWIWWDLSNICFSKKKEQAGVFPNSPGSWRVFTIKL